MDLSRSAVEDILAVHYDRRERLFDFAATLPPEELTQPVECTWESMLAILLHGLQSEDFWFQHVICRQPRPRYRLTDYPDLPSVRALAAEVRRRTMEWIGGLDEAEFRREVVHEWSPATVARFTVGAALMQVVTHEVYHRGQVLLLACRNGHDIPDLDWL